MDKKFRKICQMFPFKGFLGICCLLSFTTWAQVAPIQLGSKKISAEIFEKDYRRLLESDSIKADNKQRFLSDYIDYQLKI